MLLVGCPKYKRFNELVDGQTMDGVTFHVENVTGLSIRLSYDTDDDTAKNIIKKLIKETPDFTSMFTSVQKCDEKGKIY